MDQSRDRWIKRQRKATEWMVLKLLWKAEKALSRAKDTAAEIKAEQDIKQLYEQYQEILPQAVKKWERVQNYKVRYSKLQREGNLTSAEARRLWHDLVISRQ